MPKRAFILAAGMGSRLRPYTDTLPKPMVPVDGRPIIDHTLDHLVRAGITDVTMNLHYRAEILQKHVGRRNDIRVTFSYEDMLLDTGGGIKKALYTMEDAPFFCFSGDTLWDDGPGGETLARMARVWDSQTMDLLLLLQPAEKMTLTPASRDYDMTPEGKPKRSLDKTGQFFWPSIRIIHPRLFDDTPEGAFSFLTLMDRAEAQGRLAALEHDGICHHITTPDDLDRVNAHYAAMHHEGTSPSAKLRGPAAG
jgi:MurNAc alpha-1-phosphate uridylyltransferase